MRKKVLLFLVIITNIASSYAQTTVSSLRALKTAVRLSNQQIVMAPGDYNLEDLTNKTITCSGSNNTIDLTDVYIEAPVGSVSTSYFIVSGSDNTIIGGTFEDTYRNGMTEVTDFSAYNQDRKNLAHGLRGAAVMNIEGNNNLVNGLKLTVRGSYPYGYGSMYGIGSDNVYGLDKRCGILITGIKNTLNNVEVQQRAFGHGIYMQKGADDVVIKNTFVEGRVRATKELYEETNTFDLPFRSNYKQPLNDNLPFAKDEVHSLCEDGIRMYNIPGSINVSNCTIKKMRGGVRLYLGGPATVKNTTSIDCGNTNWNMPTGGEITNSAGNFAYAPLSDFRLSRSSMNIEWTIIPSPNATGSHNLADVLGNNHQIVFHRTPGPIDTSTRAIVVSGDNSTIINETEYPIILKSTASRNTIRSCGSVTDNGSNNTISTPNDCAFNSCSTFDTFETIEAEDFCGHNGIETEPSGEGTLSVGWINNEDWIRFETIDLTDAKSVTARVACDYRGGTIEIRLGSTTGTLIGTLAVTNTGGNKVWKTVSTDINDVFGAHEVFFVFKGGDGFLFNVNYFNFSKGHTLLTTQNSIKDAINVFQNPTSDQLTVLINNPVMAKINIYNLAGQLLFTKNNLQTNTKISLDQLPGGELYIITLNNGQNTVIKKFLKA